MRKLILAGFVIAVCWFAEDVARAQEVKPPQSAVAGESVTLGTTGSGDATLIVVGPGAAIKKQIKLGEDVTLTNEEVRYAGQYVAIVGESAAHFYVSPGAAAKINFLARPSRVPVSTPDVISGVAFIFDNNNNLVLAPTAVKFELSVNGNGTSREVQSKDGVAWIKAASAKSAGAAQFIASVPGTSVRRVVEQVASDPCNLRLHVAPESGGNIAVETDPIRDCSGNPVPDGTIVTFTESGGGEGRSTIDARIKKGVARATLPNAPGATVSVASGVVLGNEVRLGGGR